MSVKMNGINFSYDYEDLLNDIREDIDDGVLAMDDKIYIVRGDAIHLWKDEYYSPIIDYYFIDEAETFEDPLEFYYCPVLAPGELGPSESD